MAHKVKIGGTNYGISGGKTKIGGTNYGVSKGRTLKGGTGYDVSFSCKITMTGFFNGQAQYSSVASTIAINNGAATPLAEGSMNCKNGDSITIQVSVSSYGGALQGVIKYNGISGQPNPFTFTASGDIQITGTMAATAFIIAITQQEE